MMLIPRQAGEPDDHAERVGPHGRRRYARLAGRTPTVDELTEWQEESDRDAIASIVRGECAYRGLGIFLDPLRYHGPPVEPQAPLQPRPRFSHRELAAIRRSSLPAVVAKREPLGDVAYWTPERLASLRERLRAAGLPEIRPGVFRWTAGAGGSCEPTQS